MATSWRALATVPRLGLATLVQVAAAWAGGAARRAARANRIAVRRRRVRAGPERDVMTTPPPTGPCPGCDERPYGQPPPSTPDSRSTGGRQGGPPTTPPLAP